MHPDLLNWLEDEIDRTIHLLSDSGYNLIDIEHFLVKRFHTICAKHFTAPKVNRKLRPPHCTGRISLKDAIECAKTVKKQDGD